MSLDPVTCYRALVARDRRFDGVFFVGVRTTGIYCRPVCAARTPAPDRCTFYAQAAEAERDGYRACFRCRPELAPRDARALGASGLVAAAIARIEAGALTEGSVESLARELGVTARHLRRGFAAELGITPLALATSRRMALAKQLLGDERLPMTQVAYASGFRSVRRFNAAFRERFGRTPSEVRGASRRGRGRARGRESVVLQLDYRPPLAWDALLSFLASHAVAGVESVVDRTYRRTVRIGALSGWIAVGRDPKRDALRAEISTSLVPEVMTVVTRLRRLFDLDAHPGAVDASLSADPALRKRVAALPGLRIAGSFDPFEVLSRAILGQQVTVRAASTLSERVVRLLGAVADAPFPELTHAFPSPQVIAACDEEEIARIGMPRARARALVTASRAVASGEVSLAPFADPETLVDALSALPGIGPWTAQYVAMRALGWPDGLPRADLGLMRALSLSSARALAERAEAWRPFRAYAAMHLWTGGDG